MIEIVNSDKNNSLPNILVVGIGGAGNNAVDRMIESCNEHVTYVAVNTDIQVLDNCKAETRLQIGSKLTGGFGAGADPSVGAASAAESEEEISQLFENANMVILTCGMGGGTGTGAIPVIARIAKEKKILTVAVVTMPFTFESEPRVTAAQAGLKELRKYVDTLLVIPNDKLLGISSKPFFLDEAFVMADTVLKHTILGITNIIFNRGVINLDFNDLKTTLLDKGMGHLGIGTVPAGGSIMEAVKAAVNSPLLETNIKGASNILFNSAGKINIVELNEAINYLREAAGKGVNIIWGTVTSENDSEDDVVITLIATGMKNASPENEKPKAAASVAPVKESSPVSHATALKLDIPSFLLERM